MCFLWFIISVAFVILERCIKKPFLISFSMGAFVSFITSLFTSRLLIQFALFFAVSFILLIFFIQHFFSSHQTPIPANINALIGQKGIVLETIPASTYGVGQVKLDGEKWNAITLEKTPIQKGSFVTIQEIRGLRLVVSSKKGVEV